MIRSSTPRGRMIAKIRRRLSGEALKRRVEVTRAIAHRWHGGKGKIYISKGMIFISVREPIK